MSGLGAFLRGELPADAGPWWLDRRRGEGGGWDPVRRGDDPGLLLDEVLAPSFDWAHGDLVRLEDAEGYTHGVWVGAPDGLRFAGEVPFGFPGAPHDWLTAWEGPEADAAEMLALCGSVARWRVVLAACACAAAAGGLVPEGEWRPDAALVSARLWARLVAAGGPPAEGVADVQRASDAAAVLGREFGSGTLRRWVPAAGLIPADAARAASLAAQCVWAPLASCAAEAARAAASALALSQGDDRARDPAAMSEALTPRLRTLAPHVRAAVPLAVLLLGRLGAPVPPELAAPPPPERP